MDEELRQLDLATAETRRLATGALNALATPQVALRNAAVDYIESVARRRVDASRQASVEAMAKLNDDEVAELRIWTEGQVTLARDEVAREIESCDFWIPDAPGMSPTDVSDYSGALMPRPKDSRTGIPQVLVLLFERCLTPLRRGLGVVDLAVIPAEAEPRREVALLRAWRAYRESAIECVARWADVDERYHASAARFQEMRWELAGQVDVMELEARLAADDEDAAEHTVAARAAAAASEADERLDIVEPVGTDAFARADSETLIPVSG